MRIAMKRMLPMAALAAACGCTLEVTTEAVGHSEQALTSSLNSPTADGTGFSFVKYPAGGPLYSAVNDWSAGWPGMNTTQLACFGGGACGKYMDVAALSAQPSLCNAITKINYAVFSYMISVGASSTRTFAAGWRSSAAPTGAFEGWTTCTVAANTTGYSCTKLVTTYNSQPLTKAMLGCNGQSVDIFFTFQDSASATGTVAAANLLISYN